MVNTYLLPVLCVLCAVVGPSLGGIATYTAYNPYVATAYHVQPTFYHAQPVVYEQQVAPLTKTYYTAAPSTAHVVNTYSAPAKVAPSLLTTAATAVPVVKSVQYESAPRYDFAYGVHDSQTGDIKNQVETRNGGAVVGSYSVVDADGFKRTVTYTADDLNGFNAVVQREPIVAGTTLAVPAVPATPAVVAPVQYIPQTPIHQQVTEVQQTIEQNTEVVESAQVAPAPVPTPVEYPASQQDETSASASYPQDQQFPPFPQLGNPSSTGESAVQPENDDSDVIEARSTKTEDNISLSTPAPSSAADSETQDEQKKRS